MTRNRHLRLATTLHNSDNRESQQTTNLQTTNKISSKQPKSYLLLTFLPLVDEISFHPETTSLVGANSPQQQQHVHSTPHISSAVPRSLRSSHVEPGNSSPLQQLIFSPSFDRKENHQHQQIEVLQRQKRDTEEAFDYTHEKLAQKEEENQNLKRALSQRDAQLEKLVRDNDQAEAIASAAVSAAQAERDSARARQQAMSADLKEARERMGFLERDNSALYDKIAALETSQLKGADAEACRKELQFAVSRISQLESDLEHMKNGCEEQMGAAQRALQAATGEASEWRQMYNSARDENRRLQEKSFSMDGECMGPVMELEKSNEINALKVQVADLEGQVADLESQLAARSAKKDAEVFLALEEFAVVDGSPCQSLVAASPGPPPQPPQPQQRMWPSSPSMPGPSPSSRTAASLSPGHDHLVDEISFHPETTSLVGANSPQQQQHVHSTPHTNSTDTTEDKPRSHCCDVCHKRFAHKQNLNSHERLHTAEKRHPQSQVKPFECTVCAKRYTRSDHLVRHSRIHSGHKPHKCAVCDQAFSQSGHLNRHMRVHTGEKPYKCSLCDKSFSQSSHLQTHKRRVHSNSRSYECKLNAHLLKSQKDGSGFTCIVCEKNFSLCRDLEVHIQQHKPVKPYVCSES